MANFQDFGANLLMGLGAGLNPQAATLLQRQRENQFARDEKEQVLQRLANQRQEQIANVNQIIGTPGTPGTQFDPNQSPLMPVEAVPGTGLAGQTGMSQDQVDMMQQFAAASPEMVLQQLSGQIFPKPQKLTSNIQSFKEATEFGLIEKGTTFEEYLKIIKQPSTTINIGNQKPLGGKAKNWFNEKGDQADPTKTVQENFQAGFRPKTTEQIKSAQTAAEAAGGFATIVKNAFGTGPDDHIFAKDDEDLSSRLIGLVKGKFETAAQTDQRLTLYDINKTASLSSIAKLKGQVGALTDPDIAMVARLWPDPKFTPVSQAKAQFRSIVQLLTSKGVPKEILIKMGYPDWMFNSGKDTSTQTNKNLPPLPPGFTVDQ